MSSPALAAGKSPKLVVQIVVDQMRADYPERFGHQWKAGLKTVFDSGAWYRAAAYPYLQTVTCAGHATIATGTFPSTHGIVLNAWYDRATGKSTSCTKDTTASTIGAVSMPAPGHSARNLLVPTLADEMRAQIWPVPRVATFSAKARSAIMLAGHRADVAAWFGHTSMVGSSVMLPKDAEVLTGLVKRHQVDPSKFEAWDRMLPSRLYHYVDDATEESPPPGWHRTFPHALKGQGVIDPMSLWAMSPDADAYLVAVALDAVKTMGLGKGASADYLGVSFSTLDLIGHSFGPRSHEVQDVMIRLDRTLGDLIKGLDHLVGRGKYTLALTADHGVAPFPEQSAALGLPAGRIDLVSMEKDLDQVLTRLLGGGGHVARVEYTDIYLSPGVYNRLLANPAAMKMVLDTIGKQKGISAAFGAHDLRNPRVGNRAQQAAALGHFVGRSGDIVFVPQAHWLTTSSGTTHGTSNDYDQRVPLVLWGAGIKAGRYDRPVTPADIAPTLGQLVHVTLPRVDGRPLFEALRN